MAPNPQQSAPNPDTIPWRQYTRLLLGVWLAICIATFSIGMYFAHYAGSSVIVSGVLIALYLAVIILCIRRLIQVLSVAALMLLVPIAPLALLLLVVTLLPIIQYLR